MSSVLTADPADIDQAGHLRDVTRSDLVESVIKHESGRVMVFDPIRVLEGLFDISREVDDGTGFASGAVRAQNQKASDDVQGADERQLVSFEIQAQEYAFPIERVKEIVTLPPEVTAVPRAPSAMVGVMVLRERVLPLVSLRGLLGLPIAEDTLQQRVVVTTGFRGEAANVGVVVDTVREVLRMPTSGIDAVPPLLRGSSEELEAVCRLDGGKRIVTVLAADALLDYEALEQEVAESIEGDEDMMRAQEASTAEDGRDEEDQLVIFRLENEEYGIPVEAVQEIVRVPEQMTAVPKAPKFVEGVINLRGEVLPVIDQRQRFGMDSEDRSDRQRIVVLKVRTQLLGFIVDSVAEVRKISHRVIGPAPALSEAQAKIIRRVANLGDRGIILLLEPDQMISTNEGEAIQGI